VIAIQKESRLEVLREVALLLEQENRRLHQRIQQLTLTLARLQGQEGTSALQGELEALQELLSRREQALFGDSSEKRPGPASCAPEPEPNRAKDMAHESSCNCRSPRCFTCWRSPTATALRAVAISRR